MRRVTLTFYGGVGGEVGGNQILLQDGKTQILIDFGYNFSKWRRFFSYPLTQPRGVLDYFRVGLIPKELREAGREFVRREIAACLISHAHGDHYGAICALAPPSEGGPQILLGAAAKRIIKARISSRRKTPELARIAQLAPSFQPFRTGQAISIGNVEVVPWHVDHSLPGAYAFLIHTSRGLIVYTGDFRLHGAYGRRLKRQFWDVALEKGEVEALICEGTSIGATVSTLTEEDVEFHMERCIKDCKGLVIINTSICDVDRIRTICRVAGRTQRRVVAPKAFTTVLKALEGDERLNAPRVGRDVLEYEEVLEDVKREQSGYILLTSFYREREIIEVEPVPGSVFILSSSEPFEEESEIEFERLQNWLELFGVPIYHIHSSGHASPIHIRRIVKTIKPKKIFPVHTSNPQAFGRSILDILKEDRIEFIAPERGIAYPI